MKKRVLDQATGQHQLHAITGESGNYDFTPDEQAIARRLILAVRAMEVSKREGTLNCYISAIEELSREWPLHKPANLRLVSSTAPPLAP